jgi:hypothetical protein
MNTSGTHDLVFHTSSLDGLATVSWNWGTDMAGNPGSSKGLYFIPARYSWDDSWVLTTDLLVEITTSWEEVVATAYLTVQEYGVGISFEDAVLDLLTSLSDYYQSLEARQTSLGPPADEDLKILRGLVRPVTNK